LPKWRNHAQSGHTAFKQIANLWLCLRICLFTHVDFLICFHLEFHFQYIFEIDFKVCHCRAWFLGKVERSRVARFYPVQHTQTGKNMTTKCTKWQ
jgi:hypothetical protein